MKKLSFIVIALLIATVSFAQGRGNKGGNKQQPKTPEQRAEALTKRWTKALTLTAEQQPQVKQIFLTRAQNVDAIRAKYKTAQDKKPMRQELKQAKEDADNSLKGVLTPEQYDQFIKTREEARKKKAQERKVPVEEIDDEELE